MKATSAPAVTINEHGLDPEIAEFIDQLKNAADARLAASDGSLQACRAIAEETRAAWTQGGPVMHAVRDMIAPCPNGGVGVRLYTPTDQKKLPALIYVHGGGWTIFSLQTHDRIMRELAARSGMAVIGVDYALSPEHKFPHALNQVSSVVQWVAEGGIGEEIDPDRLILGGDSAGGNLSLGTALSLQDYGRGGLLSGILMAYSVIEPDCSPQSCAAWGGSAFMLTGVEMESFWKNYLGKEEDYRNPYANLSLATLDGLPPVFMAIAECDVLAEQNMTFSKRLEAVGVDVEARLYEGASHSFLEAVSISSLASRAFDDAAGWLKRRIA